MNARERERRSSHREESERQETMGALYGIDPAAQPQGTQGGLLTLTLSPEGIASQLGNVLAGPLAVQQPPQPASTLRYKGLALRDYPGYWDTEPKTYPRVKPPAKSQAQQGGGPLQTEGIIFLPGPLPFLPPIPILTPFGVVQQGVAR